MVRRGSVVLLVPALLASTLLTVAAPAVAEPAVAGTAAASDLPGGTYVRVDPVRLLDTRSGVGAPVGATTRTVLTVAGRGGVPTAGVAAVVLNVTVTGPGDAGWLAVSPTGTSATSNVNFVRGQDVAQLVTSKVDDAGRVVLTSSVRTHVVADVVGWFTDSAHAADGATYSPTTPRRLFDSRVTGSGGQLIGGVARRIPLTDVPAGATAVAVNLTGVSPTTNVFVAAWGAGPFPGTSSMNLAAGDIRSNRALVPLAGDGSITVYVNVGRSDLVVDLSGWFTAGADAAGGSRFVPLDPVRIVDTRDPHSVDGPLYRNGQYPLLNTLVVAGRRLGESSVVLPPSDALVRPTAAWLSVTVVSPAWRGWLALAPTRGSVADPQSPPGSSDVNFGPGVTPNAVLAALGDGGATSTTSNLLNEPSGVPTPDLVFDVAGIFVRTPSPASGLWRQGNQMFSMGGWESTWNRAVPGIAGDIVEVADGIALRRNGTAVRFDADGSRTALVTDGVHVAASSGGVYVIRRDGTVWTDDDRPGMHGVPGAVEGFGAVAGLTDVRAVTFGGSYGQAVHHDGTVSAWGGQTGTAGPVTGLPGPVRAIVPSPAGGFRECAAFEDGTVSIRARGGDPLQTLSGVGAVALVAGPDGGCYALDAAGRVHQLRVVDGKATDTVLPGVSGQALTAASGSYLVADVDGNHIPDVRVLTTDGTVVDRVVGGDGWIRVRGLDGATAIGGGRGFLTYVPAAP